MKNPHRPVADDAPEFPEEQRAGLRDRDPEALELFFDLYFDRVYGYVRRLVREEHLAEDLTQDIFLHVHRALPTYDPERDLRPWVFTIATNRLRDFWRSRRHQESQRGSSLDADGEAPELAAGTPRPETDLAARELSERVRAAVDELPEGMRTTVLLRIYEGLSFQAIGQVLDRNEVAVRKRYSRALEALRSTLGAAYRIHVEGSP